MSFKEDIWKRIEAEKMIFFDLNGNHSEVSLSQMRDELIENSISSNSIDNISTDRFNRFIGIINHKINMILDDFFPSYKTFAFQVYYYVLEGEEIYSLNCFWDYNIHGKSSNNLYSEYEDFKQLIDSGIIG